jgi:basic membrane protein A
VAGAAIVAFGLTACGGDGGTTGDTTKEPLKIGFAFDIGGRGDQSFNDAAAAGLERITAELEATYDVETRELPAAANETEDDKYARLKLLCESGFDPVIAVGFVYAGTDPASGPLARAAGECPDTTFAIIDDSSVQLPNVTGLTFAEEQGSFLVGVVAALKSETGHIGFIGGCTVPLIEKFEAGYIAGAEAVDPDIVVDSNYLSTPAEFCSGFNDPAAGRTAADGIYDAGADIIYGAAGGSGGGIFASANEKGTFAIGVDSDQYNTADPALREVIITSMLKRVDVAVYEFILAYTKDEVEPGQQVFDLEADGVGYSTTGGFIDDIAAQVDEYRAKIVSGEIEVPTSVS